MFLIRRLLAILQPLGLTVAPGHGPNRASTYWIDPITVEPVALGDLFLQRVGAMLRMRGRFNDSDVAEVAQLALTGADVTDVATLASTGLTHQPAA